MSGNPGGGGKGSSLPTGAGLPVSAPNQNRVLPTPAAALPNPMAAIAGAQQPTSASDLASLFECPVCFDYVLPPILQCHAGHLVCSNCRPKLTCCPTCRGQLGGNIRNLAMEKVASTVMFPCKYSSGGCGAQLLHTDKVTLGWKVDLPPPYIILFSWSTRRPVSIDPTPAPVRGPAASGRAPWSR